MSFSNGLPEEVDRLLRNWKKQIDNNEKIHKSKALKFRNLYYWLGVPATILSGLFTAGSLATIQDCKLFVICILQSICGTIVTALIGVQTYLQLMSRFVDNKMASDRYQSLSRNIDTILNTNNSNSDAYMMLSSVKAIFDDIVNTSPIIPDDNKELKYIVDNARNLESSPCIQKTIKNSNVKLPDTTPTPPNEGHITHELPPPEAEKMLEYQMQRLYENLK